MKAEAIAGYLPEQIEAALRKAEPDWTKMEEIRLRAGKPLLFYLKQKEYMLTKKGRLVEAQNGPQMNSVFCVDSGEIQMMLKKFSGYSLYAYEEEVKQGFLTLSGGHRVGLAGTVVTENGRVKTIRNLSFLNIRIAREVTGCADPVLPEIAEGARLFHTLIISPPGCGKTTLLRDLIRQISDGFSYRDQEGRRCCFQGRTVGVVDERNEISAAVSGIPSSRLGLRTDVLLGCPKKTGIFLLLRSMSPKVIAVDEIGSMEDFEAVRQAVVSGCVILATAHGNSVEEFARKKAGAAFLEEGIFERYIILSEKNGKGTIEKICRFREDGL